jgi:phosphatidylglycerol:prolipoprotein diacylglycerol transferase
VQKIAFEFGPLTIHWYGVFVAAGFLLGLWSAGRRAGRAGLAAETVYDLGPWLVVGALAGARAWYVVSYWEEAFADQSLWEVVMLRRGGLVFYGGLVGASVAYLIVARVRRLPVWSLADVLAPSIALGQCLGRLGCLMTGCCYGSACAWPWAIRFPADHETRGQPVHPTQLYEAGASLVLFAALAWFHPRKRFDGQVFALYLVLYAVMRGTVELFRGDYAQRWGGWLTPGQMMSAMMLVVGAGLWLWCRRQAAVNVKTRADGP